MSTWADAVTGKKRYATRSVRGWRREAERELARDGDARPTEGTSQDKRDRGRAARALVRPQAASDYSPKTVKETRSYLDRDLLPALGTVPLAKLRPRSRSLLPRAAGAGSRRRSACRRPRSAASTASSDERSSKGCRWGWLGVNPAAAAPAEGAAAEIKPPTPVDLARLLRLAGSDPGAGVFSVLGGDGRPPAASWWPFVGATSTSTVVLSIDVDRDGPRRTGREGHEDRTRRGESPRPFNGSAPSASSDRARSGSVRRGGCSARRLRVQRRRGWLNSLVPRFGEPAVPSRLRCRRAAQRSSARLCRPPVVPISA